MFTTKELKTIDRTYFHIINAGCCSVTLQSKNTKHYWHILKQEYPSFTSCKIQHKHKQADAFHEQGNAPTLEQALCKIQEHDCYHLHVRPIKKRHSIRSANDFYWNLLKETENTTNIEALSSKEESIMTKKNRKLTVYGATKGTHFQSTPQIRLQGDWLKENGFLIGDNIQVKCEKNKLIITKASSNTC